MPHASVFETNRIFHTDGLIHGLISWPYIGRTKVAVNDQGCLKLRRSLCCSTTNNSGLNSLIIALDSSTNNLSHVILTTCFLNWIDVAPDAQSELPCLPSFTPRIDADMRIVYESKDRLISVSSSRTTLENEFGLSPDKYAMDSR